MESAMLRKIKQEVKAVQDVPGLIIKLQTAGLFNQMEKALNYAFESCDAYDENFKDKLKIVMDLMIEQAYST
jgi:hypothetical protein